MIPEDKDIQDLFAAFRDFDNMLTILEFENEITKRQGKFTEIDRTVRRHKGKSTIWSGDGKWILKED